MSSFDEEKRLRKEKIEAFLRQANRGPLNPKEYLFEISLRDLVYEKKDSCIFELYRKYSRENRKYLQLFGLCILLGTVDIYDIGCGFDMQVGYIAKLNHLSYTGIESEKGITKCIIHTYHNRLPEEKTIFEPVDIEYINRLFEKNNCNISFVNRKYPFEIKPKANNIAIAVGLPAESMDEILFQMAQDFERLIVQTDISNAENIMQRFTEFSFLTIHEFSVPKSILGEAHRWQYLFGTKYHEEIDYLEKSNYDYNNVRFFADQVDMTRYMNNIENL